MAPGSLRGRRRFHELRASGVRGRSGPLSVTVLVDREPGAASRRVAYAIGRQVGPAVVRNRLRRRLRAIVGVADLPAGDFLVAAAPSAVASDFVDLQHHFDAAVTRAIRTAPADGRAGGDTA